MPTELLSAKNQSWVNFVIGHLDPRAILIKGQKSLLGKDGVLYHLKDDLMYVEARKNLENVWTFLTEDRILQVCSVEFHSSCNLISMRFINGIHHKKIEKPIDQTEMNKIIPKIRDYIHDIHLILNEQGYTGMNLTQITKNYGFAYKIQQAVTALDIIKASESTRGFYKWRLGLTEEEAVDQMLKYLHITPEETVGEMTQARNVEERPIAAMIEPGVVTIPEKVEPVPSVKAAKIISIKDFTDEEILNEMRRREWEGEITFPRKTIKL